MYILHYKVPLQKHYMPGKCNKAKPIKSLSKNEWFAYLSVDQQTLLMSESLILSTK